MTPRSHPTVSRTPPAACDARACPSSCQGRPSRPPPRKCSRPASARGARTAAPGARWAGRKRGPAPPSVPSLPCRGRPPGPRRRSPACSSRPARARLAACRAAPSSVDVRGDASARRLARREASAPGPRRSRSQPVHRRTRAAARLCSHQSAIRRATLARIRGSIGRARTRAEASPPGPRRMEAPTKMATTPAPGSAHTCSRKSS
mmetsp:Transcript_97140/g.279614  ORF Transcript_97140/g.279614 Transcript_97140/m.279614 type:complete len:205 (+) Transcript_97140:783-1397(+)